MAKQVAGQLPEELRRRLSGADLEAVSDKVILVFTVDKDGWPHPGLLSYFEVAATDRQHVRLAMYTDSGSTNNMRRNGKGTLAVIDEHGAYYIKGSVIEMEPTMRCTPYNAKLNLRVVQVTVDQADPEREPGAHIASGITYVNPQRAAELARGRAVVAELLEEK